LEDMAEDYRRMYQALLAACPSPLLLSIGERRQLAVAYQRGLCSHKETTAPDAELPHYSRPWYALYARVARLVPASLPRLGRQRVTARIWPPIRSYHFGRSRELTPNDALQLERANGASAVYRVLHDDPAFELTGEPFSSKVVRVVRFEMRCETADPTVARLY